jgi:hypothetical protein
MGDLLMTEENQVRKFLDGLAELSKKTGVGITFGGSGSEFVLRMVDSDGNELFEVKQLEPAGFGSESGLSYRLVFTGTMSFSSTADSPSESLSPDEELDAIIDEISEPARRFSRVAGSVVRVKKSFGDDPIESEEAVPAVREGSLVSS